MLEEGVEPSRLLRHRFLRPARMPFRHSSAEFTKMFLSERTQAVLAPIKVFREARAAQNL